MKKKWYTSKTMWVNISFFFTSITPLAGNFVGLINPMAYAILITSLAVINIGLRMITDTGVEL